MSTSSKIGVIGGGAAGFFGAITCAAANPAYSVVILEKHRQLLAKVRISGGGRCNVTHACCDPALLVRNYPRGNKALRGPFSRFQPQDTIQWFADRGVPLKTEADGRMFPVSDDSASIVNCLVDEARKWGVEIRAECGVQSISWLNPGFLLKFDDESTLHCDKLLCASGSSPKVWSMLQALGHTIVPPVPSLFTFNVPDSPFKELSGISVPAAALTIVNTDLKQIGPLLITHWGFSGPAVLKLSAWGARILHERKYMATLCIDWLPDQTPANTREQLVQFKAAHPARQVATESACALPKNLWKKLIECAGVSPELRWATLPNVNLDKIVNMIHANIHEIKGKTTYKEEFVTSGGVCLDEVHFKSMQSKLCPGLFFAGEVLDIDGITGGFNFQNAWTTSWIAGMALAQD